MDDLALLGAFAIADAIRQRRVTAAELIDRHLARISHDNPRLNALTVVFADRARREADAVDAALAAGTEVGPLAGVPFSVKESIDLTWSATTQGWRALADAVPERDAVVVSRLRATGAIPVGRGNMPDFGMRWDTDNDVFGRTVNPWSASVSAGGSSGGDGVAVATGMSALGLGSDFGGSIRIPAFANGVAGLRPSLGRLPRAAVSDQPVALTLQQFSVNGVLARRVDDLERSLPLLEGVDAGDPVSLDLPSVSAEAPRRVAVTRDPLGWGVDDAVAAAVDRAAASLSAAGWEVEHVEPPLLEEAAVLWRRLACTDMAFTLDPAQLPVPLGRSATAFLRDSTAAARPYETAREYAEAWARRAVVAAAWRRLQQEFPIILGPVLARRMPPPDFDLGGQDAATRAWRDLRLTVAVNFLGLPSVAVPTGLDERGMPTGVQLIGPMHGDRLALAAARDVEAALGTLTPPSR
ncbi:amidase family protein [Microbacterium sp. NPDC019599]|uniref:amidase n=1 Tax=Microbacterium sp. NPDC019599 TaxID=3154690 RepID=UPI0033CAA982